MDQKTPTSAFADVIQGILSYFISIKFFFKKEFITELYWKHFSYSFALALLPLTILFLVFHLEDTPLFYQCFIGAIGCYTVNWVRELIKENKAKKEGWKYPFDYLDVYFGSYGGIVAAVVVHYVINAFLK